MKRLPILGFLALAATLSAVLFLRFENSRLQSEIESLESQRPNSPISSREVSSPKDREKNKTDRLEQSGSFEDLIAIEDSATRIASLLDFAENLNPEQIPGALDNIRLTAPHWDPEAKMITHILLTRWAINDPEGALASLKGIDLKKFGADPVSVLSGVASENPQTAISWLNDSENSMVKLPFMGQILAGSIAKEWVRRDPDAALQWARELPDSQKAGAFSGVLGSLATTDPAKAATLAMELSPGGSREHIVGEIAESWARLSPNEALAWASTLTGKDRERALRSSLDQWARSESKNAAAFVGSLDAGERGALLQSVSGPWSQQEPAEAAEWVMSQTSEPESRDAAGKALGDVLWQWTTQDPESAGNWLNSQEKGPALDGAITGLARAAFEEDPGASLSWATQITDEGLRGISLAIGIGAWMERDPDAASGWAAESDIPLPKKDEE